MGLLSQGSPLSWEKTQRHAEHVRKHGIQQFLHIYRAVGERHKDVLKWGDEDVTNYFICSALTCYAISMHFGFYSWILYSPEVLMYFFYNVSSAEELPDPTTQLFFLELAIDLFPLGALVGSLLSGYIADRFGRRGSIMVINFLTIISVILLACDTWVYVYEFTICAHLLSGICLGVNFCLMYVYLFEVSPRGIRGGIIMLTDFFVKLGNVIAQILTFPSIIGYQKGWYLLVFLAGIIPLTLIFLLPKLSESPRYLMIQREDEEATRMVLWKLKASGDMEKELEELRQEKLLEEEEKKTNVIHVGKISSASKSLFNMIVIMAGSQLVGFHELYYHNHYILRTIKLDYKCMWILKTALSVLLCFTSLLATYLVDHFSRRLIFLSSLAVCTVILVLMVVVLELLREQVTTVLSYTCIFLLVIFIAAYSIGPNMLSVIISLELFLQSSRASAFAIAGFIYCLADISLTLMQDKIKNQLGSYSLLINCPFCIALFIYFYMYIPETKNHSLKNIRKMMTTSKSSKVHSKTDRPRKETSISL